MTENLGLGNRDYGYFSCEPTIKLLLDGRNVQIMEGATYTDPDGSLRVSTLQWRWDDETHGLAVVPDDPRGWH